MKTEHANYHEAFDEVTSRPKACALKIKTKKSLAAVILILISPTILAGQSVEGNWTTYHEQTGSRLSVIEIVKSGDSIEGRISQLFQEPYQGEDPVCTKCTRERQQEKYLILKVTKSTPASFGWRMQILYKSGAMPVPSTYFT